MKADVVKFLTTDPTIGKINFDFNGERFWPGGYKDVATALTRGDIILNITPKVPGGVAAQYYCDLDMLWVLPTFDITDPDDQSVLVHECTHAYHDRLKGGSLTVVTAESCGYLAEATFREALGLGPYSSSAIRAEAHRIAKAVVLPGRYAVPGPDVAALEGAVKADPHYAKKPPFVNLNGFASRSFGENVLRNIPDAFSTRE